MPVPRSPRRARTAGSVFVALLATVLMIGAAAPVQAGDGGRSRVIEIAKAQRGDRWVYGADGPDAFDCSGLVYFAFKRAGLLDRIGGRRMTVDGYWQWFARRGLASKDNGRRGDLVVWGRDGRLNGRHIGIYLGRGRAISTLTNGVRVHSLHGLYDRFVTFLHVRF